MRHLLALLVLVLVAAGCGGASSPSSHEPLGPVQLVEALQEGGLVVYVRHAATDRSKDDAGVIDLDDCSTQRNLSDAGRKQARVLGAAFRSLEIPVGDVRASEYCRTRETARLAFGRVELEPKLTGFPNEGDPGYTERVSATRALLGREPPAGQNTVLVAHTKNLEAAAALEIDEGDVAVFEPLGEGEFRHLGTLPAGVWPQLVDELAG